jgi:UDP-3-O-[3-hydroxymyristoyl] glucosamine N-acyltransferase
MKINELAAALGCSIDGSVENIADLEITGVSGLEQAGPGHLTFLSNPKYAPKLKLTQASAVLATKSVEGIATLISANPYHDYARALELFYQPPRPVPGVHPSAAIAATAKIGEGAFIGAFVAIGENVIIGCNAVLHPHAVIYTGAIIGDDFTAHSHSVVREFCRIGNRVILQNNVVIGGDGFGFAKRADKSHHKIVQSGITVIEDDVEIQSLTSIDRASMGETRVKRGAKIDSLVQVGHNCVVGEDNIICAQTGLAGSSILEKDVLLAGQVGISGHLTIHEGATIYAQSGIGGDVAPKARMSGSPAFDASEWLRAITAFQKLPEILRAVRELKKKLDSIDEKTEENVGQAILSPAITSKTPAESKS